MAPEVCPNCGADVPPKAKACPACGADGETGWAEDAAAGDLDLPDKEFDYEDFVQKEFGAKSPVPRGVHWFWWLIGVLLAGVLAFWWMR